MPCWKGLAPLCLAGIALIGCTPRRSGIGALPVYRVEVVATENKARLLGGFDEIRGGWRWTAGQFAVSLDVPPDRPVYLVLDAAVPQELLVENKAVTLTARVNGHVVGTGTYRAAERFLFSRLVPADFLNGQAAQVEFEVDRTFRNQDSGRAFGLMALSVALSNLDSSPVSREKLRQATRAAYESNRQRRNVPISASQDQELMKLFHETPIWRSFRFHAIQIEKSPLDLWSMQDAIQEIRPDFIVETGTFRGGSALFWANALNGLGLTASRVLTVDISNYNQDASLDPLWAKYVEFMQGSSTDPEIVARIAARVRGRKTLITLDSDHAAPHVLRELRMYSSLVSRGSYIVVEDTEMDGVPTYPESFPGPLAAVTQFLAEGGDKEFAPDASREQMGITYNPGGWLRRR